VVNTTHETALKKNEWRKHVSERITHRLPLKEKSQVTQGIDQHLGGSPDVITGNL